MYMLLLAPEIPHFKMLPLAVCGPFLFLLELHRIPIGIEQDCFDRLTP
jgi:hypothetical protein